MKSSLSGTQDCHSDIVLCSDSWLPRHVKDNFVKSSFQQVRVKCSNSSNREKATSTSIKKKLSNRLVNNGYSNLARVSTDKPLRKNDKPKYRSNSVLIFDFIRDSCSRKINQLIKKYNCTIVQFACQSRLQTCSVVRPVPTPQQ